MAAKKNYSVKDAAVSLFVGLFAAGCITMAIMVTLSLLGVSSLSLDSGLATLGWAGGVGYAAHRAAKIDAHAEFNAYIICVIVLVLFIASTPVGKTFSGSLEPFGDHWQRVLSLGLTLPAVLIGVHLRRRHKNPSPNLG